MATRSRSPCTCPPAPSYLYSSPVRPPPPARGSGKSGPARGRDGGEGVGEAGERERRRGGGLGRRRQAPNAQSARIRRRQGAAGQERDGGGDLVGVDPREERRHEVLLVKPPATGLEGAAELRELGERRHERGRGGARAAQARPPGASPGASSPPRTRRGPPLGGGGAAPPRAARLRRA